MVLSPPLAAVVLPIVAGISGATSATYIPPAGLTTTTSYRRYAKDGTCTTTPTVSTGTWTVTITNVPSAPVPTAGSGATTSSIIANWNVASGGPTGYFLDVATDFGFNSQ